MSPWKVILATMVIFGCGVVTGSLLMKIELPPAPVAEAPLHPSTSTNQPPPLGQFQQPQFLHRMQKQLDLTAEQSEQITKIMKDSQERTRPLWITIAPSLHEEMRRVRQEIRQVLTSEQQKKYDELLKGRPRKAAASAQPAPTNQP